jgi:hypothetical protein
MSYPIPFSMAYPEDYSVQYPPRAAINPHVNVNVNKTKQ